jgi:hypothetical protein
MTDLDKRARRALEIARSGHEPSPADRARVRAALGARVRAEPLLLDAPALSTSPWRPILDKLLVALGLGGIAGFAMGFFVAGLAAPAVAPSPFAPVPVTGTASPESPPVDARVLDTRGVGAVSGTPDPAQTAKPAPVSPVDTPAAPRAAARGRPRVTARTEAGVSPLKAELDGLRRAQELLHQGQPAWAIARLAELDRANVSSALLEERAATRAIAECTLDESGSAAGNSRRVNEFARLHPGSAHLDQVRASCAGSTRYGAAGENAASRQTEN